MATRIVLIHPGPSCDCPCDLCRDDGADATPWQHDCDGTCADHDRQGRTPEQVKANERLATWLCLIGLGLVAAILIYAGVKS